LLIARKEDLMNPHQPAGSRRALLVSLLALPLLAAASPAAPPRFEETTQVVAVEVPVNVVDREGHPVRGLTAADFEVFDEGARQPITQFEVVDLEALRPDQAPADLAAERPGGVGTVADIDAVSSAVRRHFLLLFDASFSNPVAVLRARLAARDFVLHSLRPTDLVAVATYSLASGPRLVLTFTPDRAQLAHAIGTLGLDKSEKIAQADADPLRFVITPPSAIAAGGFDVALPPGALGAGGGSGNPKQDVRDAANEALLDTLIAQRAAEERELRSYERSQIVAYTRALGAMAKALAGLKGRKTVVYFSEGFDSRLLLGREDLGSDEASTEALNIALGNLHLIDNDKRYGNTSLQSAVNRMLEEFRRADCVIQAIDIGGLRAKSNATDAPPVSGQEALFYLANETGGELFKDANNFRDQLDRVLQRSTVTYLLAFQRSDLKADGAYHRLRVKTRLAGARLSHRAGYYAPRPYGELSPLEKTLLAAEGIASAVPRSDLDVNLLVAPFRASEQRAYVPVIVEVAGPSLLAGRQKSDRLSLELYAYVINRQGQMADFFTRRIALDVKQGRETLAAAGVKYYGHLELPPGDYRVRVLVRDSESGRTGVQAAALAVPAYQKHQPVLLPPLFIEGRRHWVMVRERPKGGDGASVVYPFTVKGEPYVPAARPVLGGTDKAQLCLVGYDLGKGDLTLEGKVLDADGSTSTGGSLALVERTKTGVPGRDELLATFEPTGLHPGDYVLRVALTNRASGHTEASSLPFQVLR
jgi:VWFA-related protein